MKKIVKGFALLAGLLAFVAAEANQSCGAAQSAADKCMENKDKTSCEKDTACAFSTVIDKKTNEAVSVCLAKVLTNSIKLSKEELRDLLQTSSSENPKSGPQGEDDDDRYDGEDEDMDSGYRYEQPQAGNGQKTSTFGGRGRNEVPHERQGGGFGFTEVPPGEGFNFGGHQPTSYGNQRNF